MVVGEWNQLSSLVVDSDLLHSVAVGHFLSGKLKQNCVGFLDIRGAFWSVLVMHFRHFAISGCLQHLVAVASNRSKKLECLREYILWLLCPALHIFVVYNFYG